MTPSISYPLNQLYFYLTDTCNCRCRHCWIEPRYTAEGKMSDGLDAALFESILDQALPLGLAGIKLTGGEPLLHPHIHKLLDSARHRNISLTLETNGILCTSDMASRLADFGNISVAVSLDGADGKTHDFIRGRKGCFDAAVAGIKNLVRCGLKPQIIMTIMDRNKGQMGYLVELAESLDAGSVKFNVLQPTARGERLHDTGEMLEIEELIALGKWVDDTLCTTATIPVSFHQPPAFRRMGKMFGNGGDGCQTCGILGIMGVLADGSYALCGIGATVPEMIFGHAATNKLEAIWRNHPVLTEIRDGLPHQMTGVCTRCLLKRFCLGSCLAQNYYRRNDLWAPFWYCEDAYEKGLFPDSRLRP
ncbi:MAG: putative mycofactocin radical SAM maturase MftC [Syntrophus sp. SKADARSKE-3]|nr:putative mycofactocin radical SAM maturase MftC [Syntrophus sp. SKADARSKE-3]